MVAIPTDTVYGLSCDAYDDVALGALRKAKGHFQERPYVVLFDGATAWLDRLAARVPVAARKLMETYWPGPLTIVLPAAPGAPRAAVSEAGGIALRHPNHALLNALIASFGGPIVSTSANRTGCNPYGTAAEIARELGDAVALILDGGTVGVSVPSTVVDATQEEIRVLRRGTLPILVD